MLKIHIILYQREILLNFEVIRFRIRDIPEDHIRWPDEPTRPKAIDRLKKINFLAKSWHQFRLRWTEKEVKKYLNDFSKSKLVCYGDLRSYTFDKFSRKIPSNNSIKMTSEFRKKKENPEQNLHIFTVVGK